MRQFLSSRLLGFVASCLILQYSFSSSIFLLNGRPDLLYLVVLDYAFFWSWERVPFFAVFIGLLKDFLGGHLFGIETACLALTGWLLSLGIQKLERDLFWVRMVMTFLFVAFTETLSVIIGSSLENANGFAWNSMKTVLTTTFYTTILSPAFFWLTDRWFRRTSALKQYELF